MLKFKTKKLLSLGIMIGTMFILGYFCIVSAEVKIGSAAPEFTLKDYNEEEIHSKDFKGKVTIVNIALKHSSDTSEEWHLTLEKKYEGKPVVIMTMVNLFNKPFFVTDIMLKGKLSNDYTIAVYKDYEGKITEALGVPHDTTGLVVIDKEWRMQGYYEESGPEIYEVIDNCLK
jgi:hypothetical protein